MALTVGSRVGPFEVRAFIGEGGMGRVFRALDTKLQRDVALKVLPDDFSNDPERVSRFHREAQALAALNHPNIAQIYGFEDSTASRCLVLELVDGETLEERLRERPLPVAEALGIAKQIADALEAAHERGVIHRDLKPANIKITADGKVKVLDFGLARIFDEAAPSSSSMSQSPTMMSRSMPGVILGTAAYMSPEQARGKTVDKRTDVWAFGCVLYEMLTGQKLFEGETVSDTIARILERPLSFDSLPAATPARVRSLLRRCLRKELPDRIREIADARIEIEEALNSPVEEASIAKPVAAAAGRPILVVAAILIAIAATAAATALYFRFTRDTPAEWRLQIATPPGKPTFALSPDGTRVVFIATVNGKSQLWLRYLNSDTSQPLPGTDNARNPFWSPDSRSLGFFADQKLKRLNVAGGSPQSLADAPANAGGSWGAGNVILFSPIFTSALRRVNADGGEAVDATTLQPGEVSHRFPQFLPDGEHFLYVSVSDGRTVFAGSLESMAPKRLFSTDSNLVFATPDHILYVRQEALLAQRFDVQKLEMVGEAVPVSDHLVFDTDINGFATISASASLIAYRHDIDNPVQFTWVDRIGREMGTVGEPDPSVLMREPGGFRLSPDSKTLAFGRNGGGGNYDIWLMEVARGLPIQLATERFPEKRPVWSNDGTFVVYSSRRKGSVDLYKRSVADRTETPFLEDNPDNKFIEDWSKDGRYVLYQDVDLKTGPDLWIYPQFGEQKRDPIVQTKFHEVRGRFSPDGRWITYQSNDSIKDEIWVKALKPGSTTKQISVGGGTHPIWGKGGKEIFYLSPDNHVMAVSVDLPATSSGPINLGRPVSLFQIPSVSDYDYDAIGDRFLINKPIGDTQTAPITIVLNWAGFRK